MSTWTCPQCRGWGSTDGCPLCTWSADARRGADSGGCGASPCCPACDGPRLSIPGAAYLHKPDCSSLFTGEPVTVQIGSRPPVVLGAARITDEHTANDVEVMTAVMLREAGRNWLARLTPGMEARGYDGSPAPAEVMLLAQDLATATDADAQVSAGFRLTLALGDWLAEV